MPADLLDLSLRAAGLLAGVVVFVHFACMAARVDGRTVPVIDALLIPSVAATGVGLAYCAAVMPAPDMLPALVMCCAALTAFVLRLWALGFWVSHFLQGRRK